MHLLLAQTLHGYDRGHRLLASGGDITDDELSALDRLSDLSGYLPTGETFEKYHTGFPCGRYYAFAATWLDTTAKRAGTVLTHTLLLPRVEAAQIEDIALLAHAHKRPLSATNVGAYEIRANVAVDAGPDKPHALAGEAERAAFTLYFAQPQRPLLWVSEIPPLRVVSYIWRLLWPEQRPEFTFCTYALQARRLQGKPFELLILPPAARGSFHEFAGALGWWDEGRLLHPAAVELSRDPWVDAMLVDPATMLAELRRWCAQQALPLPPSSSLRALQRVIEMTAAARERLAAARARADLVTALWPQLAPEHPLRKAVIADLLELVSDAPLDPAPFWELRDFLARPEVAARTAVDASLARHVREVVEREIVRRFPERPAAGLDDVLLLLQNPPAFIPLEVLYRSISEGVRASPDIAEIPLDAAIRRGDDGLATAVLGALSPEAREVLVRKVVGARKADRDLVIGALGPVAHRLTDPVMAFALFDAAGRAIDGLRAAEQLALEDGDEAISIMRNLIDRVEPQAWLAWATGVERNKLGRWAAENVPATEIAMAEVVRFAALAPNGIRVFIAQALRAPSADVSRALVEEPAFARRIIAYSLTEPAAESIARRALDALPASAVFEADLREAVAAAQSWWSRNIVDRLAPRWFELAKQDAAKSGELAAWLKLPQMRTWIVSSLSPNLRYGARLAIADAGAALPRFAGLVRASLGESESGASWIHALLDRSLVACKAEELDAAAEDLLVLLKLRWPTGDLASFASEILEAARRCRHSRQPQLVVIAFPLVYRALMDSRDELFRDTSWWYAGGWDRAKMWRHWILDAWIERGWPTALFLDSIRGDGELESKCRRRAQHSDRGRAFWRNVEAEQTKNKAPT